MRSLDRLRAVRQDIQSLQGRAVNYGGSVASEPLPRNRVEQEAYDTAMKRYARAATRAASEAQARRDAANLRYLAAERVAEKGAAR